MNFGDIVSQTNEQEAKKRLENAAPEMYEALKEILDITHNHGVGLSCYVGHYGYGNLSVYTPEQLNRIGELCRTAQAKVESQ